jgi:hypothetical protein
MRLQPFTPRKVPGTHFCWRLSRPQSHSAAGRIRSIENSNNVIGNGCSVTLVIICQSARHHMPGDGNLNVGDGFRTSICPHVSFPKLVKGFRLNLVSEVRTNICPLNLISVHISQMELNSDVSTPHEPTHVRHELIPCMAQNTNFISA